MNFCCHRQIIFPALLSLLLSTMGVAAEQRSSEVDFLKNGNFEAAKKYLDVVLPQNSESASLQCNYGIALLQLHDYANAHDHLQKALTLNENLLPAWLNLAACYVCMAEFDRAISAYTQAQQLLQKSGDANGAKSLNELVSFLKEAKTHDQLASNYLNADWPRWKSGSTLRLYVDAPAKLPGYRKQFREFAIAAMQAWVDATGGAIKFEVVPKRDIADITVDWAPPASSSMFSAGHRGLTNSATMNGSLMKSPVTISLANETGFNVLRDETVKKACLHELGHALGIRGHSYNQQDIMFQLIELPTVEPRLSPRDVETIRALYAKTST